jgi:hypothetical protein
MGLWCSTHPYRGVVARWPRHLDEVMPGLGTTGGGVWMTCRLAVMVVPGESLAQLATYARSDGILERHVPTWRRRSSTTALVSRFGLCRPLLSPRGSHRLAVHVTAPYCACARPYRSSSQWLVIP